MDQLTKPKFQAQIKIHYMTASKITYSVPMNENIIYMWWTALQFHEIVSAEYCT